mgnify:CR=1 FL=1|tara:strand:- start:861 stop:989 length:129 start_codon:yes stop_codon:yes gene_type:complete
MGWNFKDYELHDFSFDFVFGTFEHKVDFYQEENSLYKCELNK